MFDSDDDVINDSENTGQQKVSLLAEDPDEVDGSESEKKRDRREKVKSRRRA